MRHLLIARPFTFQLPVPRRLENPGGSVWQRLEFSGFVERKTGLTLFFVPEGGGVQAVNHDEPSPGVPTDAEGESSRQTLVGHKSSVKVTLQHFEAGPVEEVMRRWIDEKELGKELEDKKFPVNDSDAELLMALLNRRVASCRPAGKGLLMIFSWSELGYVPGGDTMFLMHPEAAKGILFDSSALWASFSESKVTVRWGPETEDSDWGPGNTTELLTLI